MRRKNWLKRERFLYKCKLREERWKGKEEKFTKTEFSRLTTNQSVQLVGWFLFLDAFSITTNAYFNTHYLSAADVHLRLLIKLLSVELLVGRFASDTWGYTQCHSLFKTHSYHVWILTMILTAVLINAFSAFNEDKILKHILPT